MTWIELDSGHHVQLSNVAVLHPACLELISGSRLELTLSDYKAVKQVLKRFVVNFHDIASKDCSDATTDTTEVHPRPQAEHQHSPETHLSPSSYYDPLPLPNSPGRPLSFQNQKLNRELED